MTLTQHALESARDHLGAALMQSVPSDDQIIMEHVRAAHALLRDALRAQPAALPSPVHAEAVMAST